MWTTWSERVELTGKAPDIPDGKDAFTRTGGARPSPRPSQEIIVIDRRTAFRQGFISDILNPKIALLFITLLPQFIGISESRVHTSISLTVIFVAIALAWWRVTSWLAGATHRILTRDSVRRTINHISGVVLVALGLRVAFTP
ncbi:putative threonine efflux protein [Pseudonocardia sp. Ae168_Ps1]|nr:putative threonine efflux protein [Pseudonocardia sp. Ae150A_Ps1]OLL78285.1 putative threonine efflux protein [Pseudonocardia sp. Ae168_Ps1]OLL87588.1 putative threonine efflux protein [Pseudonocardia sp. Ae263_Ps1]OLL92382.1 putative threonine efflux protein [Pseudonocardia sp. Ae356_Ps1]